MDQFPVSNPRLIFEGVENFVDQELQQSEAFHRSVASEWTWWEDGEHLLLVRRLPAVPVLSVVRSFVSRL